MVWIARIAAFLYRSTQAGSSTVSVIMPLINPSIEDS